MCKPKQTVFIIGAGASVNYGFPCGPDLAKDLKSHFDIKFNFSGERLSGHPMLAAVLIEIARRERTNGTELLNTVKDITNGIVFANSIDDFLNMHSNNPRVTQLGKIGIVNAIIEKEQKCRINLDNGKLKSDFIKDEADWQVHLIKMLNCPKEQVAQKLRNCCFIIFNYDRCIEHFLFNALQYSHKFTSDQAVEILNNATFIHPYGSIGKLAWQNYSNVPLAHFGEKISPAKIILLSENIRTYMESNKSDTNEITLARKLLLEADMIISLGFKFHDQNLGLLSEKGIVTQNNLHKEFYGTALGESSHFVSRCKSKIREYFSITEDRLFLDSQCDCKQIFKEYAIGL